MRNPTNDPRVVTARAILDETARLHTQGCSRYDLLYYLGRIQDAGRMLLEVVDEPAREPRIPSDAHTFASTDGETYTCSKCGRVTDQEHVYYLGVFEACEEGDRS